MIETAGWIAMGLAALLASVNFYLSFLRYPLHKLIGRGQYRYESGLPMFGTACLLVAIVCLWGRHWVWPAAALIVLADTGGLPWFLLVMIWAFFCDRPQPAGEVLEEPDRQ